jgi:hypothetical protein
MKVCNSKHGINLETNMMQNSPGTERQVPYDLTHLQNLRKLISLKERT